ncbi:MAG TPA: DUF4390 domain-containing protein, partial [Casimicrobiaceae bacterium]|nr:DUF4390 domain-containing protein [Casimicrobiaceae bacterium]
MAARRRLLRVALAASLATWIASAASAGDIPVASASLSIDDDELRLMAEFDVDLTPALEQALDKGVPLYFTIDFELLRPRVMWFP